ncbi:hypothetical protein GCE9029_03079 [Grimontia celer]|uniref:Uncharacterized protein n=1 Tax=Grimontia celer TaxID=1796497 RepID=A0A128F727_9GAMM|nr:hypothetical protein GCE9029_03079 [Grimontia celer]
MKITQILCLVQNPQIDGSDNAEKLDSHYWPFFQPFIDWL